MSITLNLDKQTVTEWIFEKLDKFLFSKLIPKQDFPKEITFLKHYSAFRNCGLPYSYHITDRYIALTFQNSVRIHINLDWNMITYIEKIVPEGYQELMKNLLINKKLD